MICGECQGCCNQERKDSSASLLPKNSGKLLVCFKLVLHKIWWQSWPKGVVQEQTTNAAALELEGRVNSQVLALWPSKEKIYSLSAGFDLASLHRAEGYPLPPLRQNAMTSNCWHEQWEHPVSLQQTSTNTLKVPMRCISPSLIPSLLDSHPLVIFISNSSGVCQCTLPSCSFATGKVFLWFLLSGRENNTLIPLICLFSFLPFPLCPCQLFKQLCHVSPKVA